MMMVQFHPHGKINEAKPLLAGYDFTVPHCTRDEVFFFERKRLKNLGS
jgi:hypothetical protein